MNKRTKGRSLGRERDQKRALLRTLLVGLISNNKIITTLAKAKELKPFAERKLTLAKRGLDDQKKASKIRFLKKDLSIDLIEKLFEIAKISNRKGGYTRIVKLMNRKSDASKMAMIEWVDKPEIKETKKKEKFNQDKEEKANKKN